MGTIYYFTLNLDSFKRNAIFIEKTEATLQCLFPTSATNNQGLAYQVSALHNLRPALRISASEKENTGVVTSAYKDRQFM